MKRLLLALFFVPLAFALIACSAAAPASLSSGQTTKDAAAPAALPPMPAATAAPRQAGTTNSAGAVPDAASAERMIVYTVNLRLEVADTDKAVNDMTAIVAQAKGYIAATNLSRDTKNKLRGTVTLRIPAEALDATQKQIEAIGLTVLSRNKSSNDVTDQYTDLGARLKNLTATEDELRKMMDSISAKSTKADDVLAVYRELTNIRTQIEQIKGQMNMLEKTSTLATMTVELVPHEDIQVLQPDTWLPNRTAAQALRSLIQALQGLADLAIWLILFLLPIVIVLLLPFIVLAMILRALLRRRTKKKSGVTPT